MVMEIFGSKLVPQVIGFILKIMSIDNEKHS